MKLYNYIKWYAKKDYIEFYDARSDKLLAIKHPDIDSAFIHLSKCDKLSSPLEVALHRKLTELEYIEA